MRRRRYPKGHLLNCKGYLYRIWTHMIDRCYRESDAAYKNYGARGIGVCAEWFDDFEAFALYVGERPTDRHTLDRIDNDGDYEPGNVRWATMADQTRNRRCVRRVDGMTLVEASAATGVKYGTLWSRRKNGETNMLLTPGNLTAARAKCRRGHEKTEGNTYLSPSGRRCCRVCISAARERFSKRKQEVTHA